MKEEELKEKEEGQGGNVILDNMFFFHWNQRTIDPFLTWGQQKNTKTSVVYLNPFFELPKWTI